MVVREVKCAVDAQGVAVLTLNHPTVNALHPQVLQALFAKLREVHVREDVKAIVVTGANGRFSAGFDVSEFANPDSKGTDPGINREFCDLLESGAKPTVAAIQGMALGGGLEVAMACNARVSAPGASLGLPELTLGIMPGFGGTQRLPRLVGLQQGVQMILTSKPIKAEAGLKSGLVDAVVAPDKLLETAKSLALDMASQQRHRPMSLYRTDKLESLGEALGVLNFAREQAQQKAAHVTHPLLCLDAIRAGVEQGGQAGLAAETRAFAEAQTLDQHKALIHIFFAQRSTKRVSGVTDAGLKPRPIKRVAVLGGGLMGSGIATASILAGIEVLLKEINEKFLEDGLKRVKANIAGRVKKGAMPQKAADAALTKLKGTLSYDDFKSVDLVIEAAIENVKLKQQIFADLEKACKPDAILSSNTSTIDISLVGAKTGAADRIVGAHFFSPAHIMPLLEIVRTDKTSKQVILDTLEYATRIKKTPVVVGNCTGFAVNRVFFPYTQSACLLLDLGVDPYMMDKAIQFGFGMPMGPFRLSDLVGADINLHVGANFLESFPERVYRAAMMKLMNDKKMLGEKTGGGFYKFDAKRKASPNPDIKPVIVESRKIAKLGDLKPPVASPQDIIEFIFFPVVNEGCRVIAEGIVDKPADLDVATVMAMGFPAYRGGLIKWADLLGPKHVADKLSQWAKHFESVGLAGVFKPCDYLVKCAAEGRPLGAGVSPGSKM